MKLAEARIRQFRFMTTRDARNTEIANWSRTYEWTYALYAIATDPRLIAIHNTCCGENTFHRQFADLLGAIPGRTVCSSDTKQPDTVFPGFFVYDVLDTPLPSMQYDCVLCISTLEDLLDRSLVERAVGNLLQQATRRLIITADHPGMRPEWLADIFGCSAALDETDALTGDNSAFRDGGCANLRILLLDVECGAP